MKKAMTITYPIGEGLYVNLTNRCPCACEFCLRGNADGVGGSDPLWLEHEPSEDEVLSSLDSRNLGTYKEVVFCGYGEPTERLDMLLAAARHVRSVAPSCRIRLNTNGLSDLINGRPTAALLEGLFDTVSISLNTSDPEEYLRVCHPKFGLRSHQALIDFASECVRHVPDVVMTVVDEPATTKAEQEACRRIAESIGARLRVRRYEGPAKNS